MKSISSIKILFLIPLIFVCKESSNQKIKSQEFHDLFERQRYEMVEDQIYRRDVSDELVLKAMRKVPRHEFVPPNLMDYAYSDHPLPIGEEQTISQPYIVAFMTECLQLKGGEKVLEIGTGSAYQAAILAEITAEVYTIEIIPTLTEQAEQRVKRLGYKNIRVRCADGYQGWPDQAPFDGIIVTAAPPRIPQPLVEQLKPGGKMIIPVGDSFQELILVEKTEDGKISKRSVLPVRFVPMTGKAQQENE
jgi:protein-L-isoaspartate(D-aspartate) O-methyltransferase